MIKKLQVVKEYLKYLISTTENFIELHDLRIALNTDNKCN